METSSPNNETSVSETTPIPVINERQGQYLMGMASETADAIINSFTGSSLLNSRSTETTIISVDDEPIDNTEPQPIDNTEPEPIDNTEPEPIDNTGRIDIDMMLHGSDLRMERYTLTPSLLDQITLEVASRMSGGPRRSPSPITLFSPFHSDDEEDIPGPLGTVISRQTGMILGQPTPATNQLPEPVMFTDIYQSSSWSRIRLRNPEFRLIRINNENRTYLYAYKIGDRHYSTHDFSPIDLNERSFTVLGWPPDVVLHSQPILIEAGNYYGIYQTIGGVLSSIVPLHSDSVIVAIHRLNITVEVDGRVRMTSDILPPFDGSVENGIFNCISQNLTIASLYGINVPGDTQRHRPLSQDDQEEENRSQRINNGYESQPRLPAGDNDSHESEDESDWYIPPTDPDRDRRIGERIQQSLLESALLKAKDEERTFITENVVQTLLRQLYNIPVDLPAKLPLIGVGVHGEVISFDRARELLEKDMVTKFSLDPYLQPWAGPPNGSNRIITLTCTNGSTYLVKAQYVIEDNQIFPPL